RGLVRRRRGTTDARRIELSLTPHGRAALRRVPQPAQSRLVAALNALPARECQALARALRLVVNKMHLTAGRTRMFFEAEGRNDEGRNDEGRDYKGRNGEKRNHKGRKIK